MAVALMAAFSDTDPILGDEVPQSIEIAELRAADGLPQDGFGGAIAVDGDCLVVGASSYSTETIFRLGSAYVFCRTGSRWHQVAQLFPSPVEPSLFMNYSFGRSVAMDGDWIAVGAPQIFVPATSAGYGAAYVFKRDRRGTPNDPLDDRWRQDAWLTSPDALRGSDQFGFSVAISAGTLIVGRPGWENISSGSAYVYQRVNGVWSHTASLTPSDSVLSDQFGDSVALDGGTAVVGATRQPPPDGVRGGAAYVFRQVDGDWIQETKFFRHTPGGAFGQSVSIDNGLVAVCGTREATIFQNAGGNWVRQATFTGPPNSSYALRAAIKGQYLLVADPGYFDETTGLWGTGRLHERNGDIWTEDRMFVDSTYSCCANLGAVVALGENHAFLNRADSVYAYVLPHTSRELRDFAEYANCFSGGNQISVEDCESFDFLPDDKVNLPDFAEFSALFGGP